MHLTDVNGDHIFEFDHGQDTAPVVRIAGLQWAPGTSKPSVHFAASPEPPKSELGLILDYLKSMGDQINRLKGKIVSPAPP
jgi:hypothetical protein